MNNHISISAQNDIVEAKLLQMMDNGINLAEEHVDEVINQMNFDYDLRLEPHSIQYRKTEALEQFGIITVKGK